MTCPSLLRHTAEGGAREGRVLVADEILERAGRLRGRLSEDDAGAQFARYVVVGALSSALYALLFVSLAGLGSQPANLVGAVGFRNAVQGLERFRLVCVDEFELDDAGDTMLMSRLLRELADAGVRLAATSNTLPDALGEGRFAADDFRREIQSLATQFDVVRIDGEDYRHRGLPPAPSPLPPDAVPARRCAAKKIFRGDGSFRFADSRGGSDKNLEGWDGSLPRRPA